MAALICAGLVVGALAAPSEAQTVRTISTVAGNGTPGPLGDGGLATEAQLHYPWGLARDSSGNLFIADLYSHRIRRVDAATGIITTVAGTGEFGYSGDGGLATAAKLTYPYQVAVDAAGNLYFNDYVNSVVRKVSAATGIITAFAGTPGISGFDGDGGPATAAKLNNPFGIAVDADGNVFFADGNNNRIRRVDAASGVITTVAGTGQIDGSGDGGPATEAGIYFPEGLTIDSAGNLYFTDYQSSVRKVDAATGIISTVAGVWGEFISTGDGGLATEATFEIVTGVAVDGAGNLYIPDNQGYRLRYVDAATGIISTIAGTGAYGFGGDDGPASAAVFGHLPDVIVDEVGNCWVADMDNHRIRLVTGLMSPAIPDNPADKTVVVGGTVAWSLAASGVPMPSLQWQVSTDGGANFANLADAAPYSGVTTATLTITAVPFSLNGYQYRLVATNSVGQAVSAAATLTVTRLKPVVAWPSPSAILPGTALGDTQLNATASVPGTFAYDPPSGTVMNVGTEQVLRTTFTPTDLSMYEAVSAAVLIDVIGAGGEGARLIDTVAGTGAFGYSGDGGPATQAQFYFPLEVKLDQAGNLFIPDSLNHRVRRVDHSTGIVTTVAGTGVAGFNGDGLAATATQISQPAAVAFDPAGNLYIAEYAGHRVRKVDALTGLVSTVAGTGVAGFSGDGGLATAAALNAPRALAVDLGGNLYISDSENVRIRMVDAQTGLISTIAGGGWRNPGDGYPATEAILAYVSALRFDAAGNLYLAPYNQHRIRMVSVATGIITTVAGSGTQGFSGDGGPATLAEFNAPVGLDVDQSGDLYITDYGNNRVRKVTAAAGIISTIAGTGAYGFAGDGGLATAAAFRNPGGVTIGGPNRLYVSDGGNHRVRLIAEGMPPVIFAQPSDASAVAGTTVTFTASAAGHPLPGFQWQVSSNGVDFDNLTNGAPYSGVTTQLLTITGAAAGQTGLKFRVLATNGFGQAISDPATLTVTPAAPVNGPPYTLTVVPPAGGTIQGAGINCGAGGAACSVTMPAPMTLGLGATASAGYTFSNWTGDCSGTTTSQWLALNGPRTCSAVFTPVGGGTYQLSITPKPTGGTVTGNGLTCGTGGATCAVTFGGATTATLTAAADTGFVFSGWGGACSGTSASTSVLVDATKTCSATFTASGGPVNGPPYTLTVVPPAGGTIQGAGINCGAGGAACSVTMPAPMTLGLGATASAGYTFSNWTGDCSGTTTSQWLALNGPRTCGAVFTPVGGGGTYQLSITPKPTGGTVTGNGLTCGTGGAACAVTFGGATTATLTAAADTGFVFSGWGGACSGTSASTSVLVDAAKTCSATFTASGGPVNGPPYTLTVVPPVGGTIQGAGINCGAGGAACSVTMPAPMTLGLGATASAGYTFSNWTGDCSGTTTSQWLALNGPRTCSAVFTPVGGGTYQLSITPKPTGGTVTGNGLTCGTGGAACAVTFGGATTATLTAAADTGFVFSGWGGACSGTSASTSVLVDAAKTCSATFTASGGPVNGPPYTLTVVPPVGGTIQGAGINCGAGGAACSVTMPAPMTLGLSATASAGYTFTNWTGDCSGTTTSQWLALNGPRTCSAVFTPVR